MTTLLWRSRSSGSSTEHITRRALGRCRGKPCVHGVLVVEDERGKRWKSLSVRQDASAVYRGLGEFGGSSLISVLAGSGGGGGVGCSEPPVGWSPMRAHLPS